MAGRSSSLSCPEAGLEEAAMIAERIRKLVEGTPVANGGGSRINLTVSMGISNFPSHRARVKRRIGEDGGPRPSMMRREGWTQQSLYFYRKVCSMNCPDLARVVGTEHEPIYPVRKPQYLCWGWWK